MLVFSCISPHPPLLLPDVGSAQDRAKVKKTITALKKLGQKLASTKPDQIIISSPHPDWGFNVPLHFLNPPFAIRHSQKILTTLNSPKNHFQKGQKIGVKLAKSKLRFAWIASGDLSHHSSSGPAFDQKLIQLLKNRDIANIINLDPKLTESAAECGLRSFCLALGALETTKINWQPKILAYENPFGVGYLTARLL